jgi:hypothetical protein
LRRKFIREPGSIIGATMRHAIDGKRDRGIARGQSLCGKHHPGFFLRARIIDRIAGAFDNLRRLFDLRAIGAAFDGQRQNGSPVAQARAEIGSRQAIGVFRLSETFASRREDLLRAAAITKQCKRRSKLRARQRRLKS